MALEHDSTGGTERHRRANSSRHLSKPKEPPWLPAPAQRALSGTCKDSRSTRGWVRTRAAEQRGRTAGRAKICGLGTIQQNLQDRCGHVLSTVPHTPALPRPSLSSSQLCGDRPESLCPRKTTSNTGALVAHGEYSVNVWNGSNQVLIK